MNIRFYLLTLRAWSVVENWCVELLVMLWLIVILLVIYVVPQ